MTNTTISPKTQPRNSAGIPATGTPVPGAPGSGPCSTAPPPRDTRKAARHQTARTRWRPGSTARRTADARRRSGPCPTRTASASRAVFLRGPNTALMIIMLAPIRIAMIRKMKTGVYSSPIDQCPRPTATIFVNGFTKSDQKKSRRSPGWIQEDGRVGRSKSSREEPRFSGVGKTSGVRGARRTRKCRAT